MKRRWKILIAVVASLAVLLALNTIIVDQQTKTAGVTVPGGRIVTLPGGDLQVLDKGPRSAPAIVLLHCYTCAIDYWSGMIPLLDRTHRVIAIDLLGHGGSEKPASGYSMANQADLVAQVLGKLGVSHATLVGHSLGGTVETALAEQAPELVDRLVIIDQAPDTSYGGPDLLRKLSYLPVLGEALWRTAPDFAIRNQLGQAFAPGYDVPDSFVEDVRRMTFTAYDETESAAVDYADQEPLNSRIRSTGLPLLVIFGAEDQIYDAREAISAYAAIPGVKTDLIPGAGHSPNVEKPRETANLVLAFAKPPPPPPPPKPRHRLLACGAALGSSRAAPRNSIAAGRFHLFGPGQKLSTAQRSAGGALEVKLPVILVGRRPATLSVPASERSRVGLLYGPSQKISRPRQAYQSVTFRPCARRKQTGWAGGLALADRRPVVLKVTEGKRTRTIHLR